MGGCSLSVQFMLLHITVTPVNLNSRHILQNETLSEMLHLRFLEKIILDFLHLFLRNNKKKKCGQASFILFNVPIM